MASRYHEVYAGCKRDPEASGPRRRSAIDWYSAAGTRCSIPRRRLWPLVPRRDAATPATTRSTATSAAGAPTQSALIYDSPVTGTMRAFTYAELRDEVARSPAC